MNKHQTVITSLNNITTNISTENIIKPRESILIAVSGGQDSICLFFIFIQLKKQWHWSFGIIYCNHLWQKNSFFSGSLILKIAYMFAVSIYYVTTTDKIFSEQDSRKWRYAIFFRISSFYNYTLISSGHTESDKTETILFQFIRGGSLKSLVPLKTVKNFKSNSKFVRKKHITNTFIYFKKNLIFFLKKPKFSILQSQYNKQLTENKTTYYFSKLPPMTVKKNQLFFGIILWHSTVKRSFCLLKNQTLDCYLKKNKKLYLVETNKVFFNIRPGPLLLSYAFYRQQRSCLTKKKQSFFQSNLSGNGVRSLNLGSETLPLLLQKRKYLYKKVLTYKPFIQKKIIFQTWSAPFVLNSFNSIFHKNYSTALFINVLNFVEPPLLLSYAFHRKQRQKDLKWKRTDKKRNRKINLESMPKLIDNKFFQRNSNKIVPIFSTTSNLGQNIHFLIRPITVLDRFTVKKLVQYFILPVYPDISNTKKQYYRNRIRSELIPTLRFFFNPQIHNRFFQFSEILINEQFHLNLLCKQLITELYVFHEKKFTLNITLFQNLPTTIQNKLVQILIKDCTNISTNFNNIHNITKLVEKPRLFYKKNTIKGKEFRFIKKKKQPFVYKKNEIFVAKKKKLSFFKSCFVKKNFVLCCTDPRPIKNSFSFKSILLKKKVHLIKLCSSNLVINNKQNQLIFTKKIIRSRTHLTKKYLRFPFAFKKTEFF